MVSLFYGVIFRLKSRTSGVFEHWSCLFYTGVNFKMVNVNLFSPNMAFLSLVMPNMSNNGSAVPACPSDPDQAT